MLRSMLVLGGVAAANMPTTQAETQVDPGISRLEAIFTAIGTGSGFPYLIEVGTSCCRHSNLP